MSNHGLWTGQSYYLHDSGTSDNWWLDGSYKSPPSLTLRDAVVNTVNTDNFWSGSLATFGPSTITNGIHVGAFSGFAIDLQRAIATLDLQGKSSVGYDARFSVAGSSTLSVDGTLLLDNANSSIQTPVAGSGNIVNVGSGNRVEFGNSVGGGETIWCLEGLTTFDQPQLIQANIHGVGDGLILKGDFSYIGYETLTSSDLTFLGFNYRGQTTAYDLHINNTPDHQVVMSLGNDASGARVCFIQANGQPIGASNQVVVHQTT